jgi:hypothetical protein
MRGYALSLALLVAAGCTSNQVSFEHKSQVQTRAKGVALLDTDDSAQVGMSGNTCEVTTSSGMIGSDYDVAVGEDDNVQDALGTDTLVIGQSGVYVVSQGFFGPGSPVVDMNDVVTARFSDDGVVVGRDTSTGFQIDWAGGITDGSSAQIGPDANLGGMSVDRGTGTAYIPTDSGLAIADANTGVTVTEVEADITAWDTAADCLYVATTGSSEVRAIEFDGTLRWATDVGGPVTSIDDMAGAAAVMVGDDNAGVLVVLDGVTGESTSQFDTPSAANRVVVGNGGHSMAMVLDDVVHFFGVDASLE